MSKSAYIVEGTNFLGGVNQLAEEATLNEAEIGQNVWAVNGKVETRPGFTAVVAAGAVLSSVATILSGRAETNGVFSSPSGAGVLTLDSLQAQRDFWYIGHTAQFRWFRLTVPTTNSAATVACAEYWNGTRWAPAYHQPALINATTGAPYHLSSSTTTFAWPIAGDWAQTTVDSLSRYWLRFRLLGANLDASVSVDLDDAGTEIVSTATVGRVLGLFAVQFPTHAYNIILQRVVGAGATVVLASTLGSSFSVAGATGATIASSNGVGAGDAPPATIAVVPQFEEAFVAYDGLTTRFGPFGSTPAVATVDTSDFSTGPRAPYDKSIIAQLNTWPRGSLTAFVGGRLWMANGVEIRWSGPQPHHKVWPALSYDYLMEDDNSPIVTIKGLGEQLVIYKRDSIWMAIPTGFNPQSNNEGYAIKRIVPGVGCAAPNSVTDVMGTHVFLGEDGVYQFDGTPNIRKVSDRVFETIASVSKSRRLYAAGVNWTTAGVYLLSFSTSGQAHDTTLCWEYPSADNPTSRWWVWSGVDAQVWCTSEGTADEQRLYFGNKTNDIFEMGVGKNDWGTAISSHLRSHRFGFNSDFIRKLRSVRVIGSNQTRTLSVKAVTNDVEGSASTMSFVSYPEKDWGSLDWVGSDADDWSPFRRRARREGMQPEGEWHQIDITHAVKDQQMSISRVDAEFMMVGRR